MSPEPCKTHDAVVDVVMPARNEAQTVGANVRAARGCRYVRQVIVVDDGSTDATSDVAVQHGATVVRRRDTAGSKAHAMQAGVDASDASHILFVDADCTALTSEHLDAVCEPVLAGRADMSLGAFDYGWLNWLVLRFPPLTGERIVPRSIWETVPHEKLDGYTIEIRINQVVSERRLRTSARTMVGVFHRTKRDKFGLVEGFRRTWVMYRDLISVLRPIGDVRWRTYWYYLRGLTIEEPAGSGARSD